MHRKNLFWGATKMKIAFLTCLALLSWHYSFGSDLKKYSNKEYSFEVSYPQEFSLTTDNVNSEDMISQNRWNYIHFSPPNCSNQATCGATIEVLVPNAKNQTVKEFLKDLEREKQFVLSHSDDQIFDEVDLNGKKVTVSIGNGSKLYKGSTIVDSKIFFNCYDKEIIQIVAGKEFKGKFTEIFNSKTDDIISKAFGEAAQTLIKNFKCIEKPKK
jgi:hypothetical protein